MDNSDRAKSPTATPAPDWKAGDRAMVRIAQIYGDYSGGKLKGGTNIRMADLHPLPALSVEDAAVLAFAHDVNRALSRPNADIPHFGGNADLAMTWHRFITAVRARAARSAPPLRENKIENCTVDNTGMAAIPFRADGQPPTQQTPEIAAARDAVVEAGRAAFEKWNGPPAHVPFDEMVELGHRLDALNALLTPPEPPDPVAELREAANEWCRSSCALIHAENRMAKDQSFAAEKLATEAHAEACKREESAHERWVAALAAMERR